MDGLIPLVGLYLLALVVWGTASPFLARARARRTDAALARLERRLEAIEARLGEVSGAPPSSPAPEPPASPPSPEPAPAPETGAPPPEVEDQPAASGTGSGEDASDVARPAARADLESRVGGRLFVWLGAVALACAGAFLVKYSIDEGLLTPAMRVAGGYVFGGVLLAAGARLRRRDARIAAAVLAAGIACLYVATWAAVALYGLIGPIAAFAVMVAITTAAELTALRFGRLVAHVGVAGGYLTPILVPSEVPSTAILFGYLFLLTFGLGLVGLRRPWPDLVALAVAAAYAWAALWLATAWSPADLPILVGFLLAVGGLVVAIGLALKDRAIVPRLASPRRGRGDDLARIGAAAAGLLLLAAALEGDHDAVTVVALWVYAAAALGLARWRQALFDTAPTAALIAGAALAAWSWPEAAGAPVAAGIAFVAFALLWGLGGFLGAFGAASPGRWAMMSAVPVFLLATLAHARDVLALDDAGWAAATLATAAAYAGGAAVWSRYRVPDPRRDTVLATLVVASGGLIALAASLLVTIAWLALAWSLTAAVAAGVHRVLPVPGLRRLAAALALLAVPGVLAAGEAFGTDATALDALARAVVRAGLPALALAYAAWRLGRDGPGDIAGRMVEATAVALGAAFLFYAARAPFGPIGPDGLPGGIGGGWALGLVIVAWTGYALALDRLATAAGPDRPGLSSATGVMAVTALAAAAYGGVAIWGADLSPGRLPLLNALLAIYAVPAAAAPRLIAVARRAVRIDPAPVVRPVVLLAAFALVTALVRHGFHAPALRPGPVLDAELYGYSAAWVGLAVAAFAVGLRRRDRMLRAAGLAIMTLALAKVFLYDAAALDGLLRVASFLGLGLALLGIAYLFRHFVAPEPPEPESL